MASSTSLPDDILIEIFTYLPLNSLCNFKCLSKVWLSNLSSPNFITKWLQINNKSLPWIHYHTIINRNSDPIEDPMRFKYAYPESHSKLISRNQHLFSFQFPINEIGANFQLLGSSNGLVLCWSVDYYQKSRYHVCNPLTQKWVSLPSPPGSQANPFDVNGILCGYSSSSLASWYKVVRFARFRTLSKKFIVDVFSSDLGVWKSFQVSCDEDVAWDWSNFDKVIILNGVLYWIGGWRRMLIYNLNQENGSDGHRCSLMNLPSVDFGDDESSCVSPPDFILGESEGRVCYVETKRIAGRKTVSVWVLDDLSWQILHKNVSVNDTLAEVCSLTDEQDATIHVLGFSPVDRNVILLGWMNCVWGFNTRTKSVEELSLDDRDVHNAGVIFKPFVLKPMPTVLPPPSWIDA